MLLGPAYRSGTDARPAGLIRTGEPRSRPGNAALSGPISFASHSPPSSGSPSAANRWPPSSGSPNWAVESRMIGVSDGFMSLPHAAPPGRALASLIVGGAFWATEPLTVGGSGGFRSPRWPGWPQPGRAVEPLTIGGSGADSCPGPPSRALESLMIGVPSGIGRFARVTLAGWATLAMAMAGLTAPARPKASAPPEATTTSFLIMYRSHSVVLSPDRRLRHRP